MTTIKTGDLVNHVTDPGRVYVVRMVWGHGDGRTAKLFSLHDNLKIIYYPPGNLDPLDLNSPRHKDIAYEIAEKIDPGCKWAVLPDLRPFTERGGDDVWRIVRGLSVEVPVSELVPANAVPIGTQPQGGDK